MADEAEIYTMSSNIKVFNYHRLPLLFVFSIAVRIVMGGLPQLILLNATGEYARLFISDYS